MFLPTRVRTMRIFNFLVLPDGTVTHDMKHVRQVAADYRMRFFGTGQIQLVFPDTIGTSEREDIFGTFMQAIEPVLEAMESGVEK